MNNTVHYQTMRHAKPRTQLIIFRSCTSRDNDTPKFYHSPTSGRRGGIYASGRGAVSKDHSNNGNMISVTNPVTHNSSRGMDTEPGIIIHFI